MSPMLRRSPAPARPSFHAAAPVSLASLCGLLVAIACAPASDDSLPPRGDPATPPNVLVYMVDTLRADGLPTHGNAIVETPAISALAADAVVYERAFAPSSWTRTSVASLFSGLAPDLHQVLGRDDPATASVAALATAFAAAGHRTGAIVTNPNVSRYFGFQRGFDTFVEAFNHTPGKAIRSETPRARAPAVTRRALAWIDESEAPWFLFILVTDPHGPYAPPREFDRYGMSDAERAELFAGREQSPELIYEMSRRRYLGEVAFTDHAFGRLVDGLKTRGLYDAAMVVLTSDHGEHFGEQGSMGHGRTLFQAVLHIPLIVKLPGGAHRGRRVQTPVQLVDLHPTLLHVAGIDTTRTEDADIEIIGAAAVLPVRERPAPRPAFAHLDLGGRFGEMIYDPPWKYIRPLPGRSGERALDEALFDLEHDPLEAGNVLVRSSDVALRLAASLDGRAALVRAQAGTAAREGALGEMPEDVRQALEHLGYIEPSEPPAPAALSEPSLPADSAPR